MVWDLEIMLQLVAAGHVSAAKVIEVAESIHSINPIYTTQYPKGLG